MIKKLKQKSGETLMETLISMLIAILCIGLLSSAIMAATNINKQTRELDKKYSDELNAVEGRSDDVRKTSGTIVITFKPSDGSSEYVKSATVTVYGEEDGAFLAYEYKGETP